MSEIFGFSEIEKLFEKEKPTVIIVVDTNILISEPNFKRWVSSGIKPIYVISDSVLIELEKLKAREGYRPGQPNKPREAFDNYKQLLERGKITDGVKIEGIGWFISIHAPEKEAVDKELGKWVRLVKTFPTTDCTLFVLGKELRKFFELANFPVFLATQDKGLLSIAESNKLPVYRFETNFMGINALVDKYYGSNPSLDWVGIINGMEKAVEERAIYVDLTLNSISDLPAWLKKGLNIDEEEKIKLAEGDGVIHNFQDRVHHFQWHIIYRQFSINLAKQAYIKKPEILDSPKIELLEKNVIIPDSILDNIKFRLMVSCKPQLYVGAFNFPSLREPLSILQNWLYFQYEFENEWEELDLPDNFEERIQNISMYNHMFVAWLFRHEAEHSMEETEEAISSLLDAFKDIWRIGETVNFSLIVD